MAEITPRTFSHLKFPGGSKIVTPIAINRIIAAKTVISVIMLQLYPQKPYLSIPCLQPSLARLLLQQIGITTIRTSWQGMANWFGVLIYPRCKKVWDKSVSHSILSFLAAEKTLSRDFVAHLIKFLDFDLNSIIRSPRTHVNGIITSPRHENEIRPKRMVFSTEIPESPRPKKPSVCR